MQPTEGLQSNSCSLSRPFHKLWVWERVVRPPGSRGRALASIWVPAGQGWGPGGMRALKGSSGRLPGSKLTACLPLDTSVFMCFPVLCLALSLAGTGETVGKMWEGGWAPILMLPPGSAPLLLALPHGTAACTPATQSSPDLDTNLSLISPSPTLKSNLTPPQCHLARTRSLLPRE